MSKRRGLGRGLDALMPADKVDQAQQGVLQVPIKDIKPNPRQPRTVMDEELLAELGESIAKHGLIQPLIVTSAEDGYTLIAGERRWRASQVAGLSYVPVIVKETTPQEMLELAIIENIQRADLNPLEEALAYRQLMDDFGLTQEDVAGRVSKGRSTVANLVRLLNLPRQIQESVLAGDISAAHAREILRLPTTEMQINAANQVVKHDLNRRQTIILVDNLLVEEKPTPKIKKSLPPEYLELQKTFEESLGTRVSIERSKNGGRVVIHYYSEEDLQSIYEIIVSKDNNPDE